MEYFHSIPPNRTQINKSTIQLLFFFTETEQTSVSKLKINALLGIINRVSLTRTGDRVVAALELDVVVIDYAEKDIVVGAASRPWLLLGCRILDVWRGPEVVVLDWIRN
jgi:hypothetical protein